MNDFERKVSTPLKLTRLQTVQVNMGDLCNQKCSHCHINGSPTGSKIMHKNVISEILKFLSVNTGLVLDITGGCPELNPNFRLLIEKSLPYVSKIMVRTNLTIMLEKNMGWLSEFYKKHRIVLMASMPCYTKENVDKQRGIGVFEKCISALKMLNELGYGKSLELNLVYNPGGAFLPGLQSSLEKDYHANLKQYGVIFNHLFTITNAPINRFKNHLEANGDFDKYMNLLIDSFNPGVAADIMCRDLLSVGWDGILYDCDFNQALGLSMRDKLGKIMEIKGLSLSDIEGKEIIFENHCYCCAAGAGSSCKGSLAAQQDQRCL